MQRYATFICGLFSKVWVLSIHALRALGVLICALERKKSVLRAQSKRAEKIGGADRVVVVVVMAA